MTAPLSDEDRIVLAAIMLGQVRAAFRGPQSAHHWWLAGVDAESAVIRLARANYVYVNFVSNPPTVHLTSEGLAAL